jgi:Pectate lyase superfamily protein
LNKQTFLFFKNTIMPLKRIPNPNADANAWGTLLNEHLAQTHRPADGGLNKFTPPSTLPSGLTPDDVGRSYLNTQSGYWHEWDGTKWIVLSGSGYNTNVNYCDVVYCDDDKIPYYQTYNVPSNPAAVNNPNAPESFSIYPALVKHDFIFNRKNGKIYRKDLTTNTWAQFTPSEDFTVTNKFTGTSFRCVNVTTLEWLVVSPNGIVNVRDFGARGDGFGGVNYGHDDTTQIQAAITYAATTATPSSYSIANGFTGRGCVVYFPHGNYKITNEILVRGVVCLRGDGGGAYSGSIINQTTNNKNMFVITEDLLEGQSNASQFDNLFFRVTVPSPANNAAIITTVANKSTNSIYIRNCFFQTSGTPTWSIDFLRGDDIQISGCTFDVGQNSIRLGSNPANTAGAGDKGNTAENTTIQNCTFYDITNWIIDAKNVKNLNIIGNRFYFGGANICINIGINTIKAENVNISGNTFENCKTAVTVGTLAKRINIQGNVISDCSKTAIDIVGGDILKDFMCTGNTISGNFIAVGGASTFFSGGAISAGGCGMTFSIVKDNIIQGDENGTASTVALNFPDTRTVGNNIKDNLIHGFSAANIIANAAQNIL